MPFDDDAEADNPGFSPPPHPDDRLWRHPSEMRAHPIVPLGASGPPLADDDTATDAATDGGDDGDDDRPRRRPWGAFAAAGAVGAALAVAGVLTLGIGERVVERPVTERVDMAPRAPALDGSGSVEGVRERVAPAVVGVATVEGTPTSGRDEGQSAEGEGGSGGEDEGGSGGEDADGAAGSDSEGTVAGSGVVVRDDGIVVTSLALLPATGAVTLRLADGTTARADVVGTDPATGLAVLDLEGDGYPTGVLATDTDAGLAPGDQAFPLGATVPGDPADGVGLVGGAERHVGPGGSALDGVAVVGEAEATALGGPVLDERGAVVGIVTTVEEGEAWYVAPVEVARKVTDDLLADGVVHHGWLGIEGTDEAVGAGTPSTTSSDEGGGTRVASVVPDSPAAQGGLRAGDVIVALGGEPVTCMSDLLVHLRARSPGDRVEPTVTRDDGSQVTLVLTLGEPPAQP